MKYLPQSYTLKILCLDTTNASEKNEILGINNFARKAPRKRLIFRSVEVGLASTLLMKRCIYRGIRAFLHFRITFSFLSYSMRKTIERISVSTQIPRRSQFDGEKRQLLITFLPLRQVQVVRKKIKNGLHFLNGNVPYNSVSPITCKPSHRPVYQSDSHGHRI